MQDIRQETLNECTRAEQSASVVLWEIDLTEVGLFTVVNLSSRRRQPAGLAWGIFTG
ncbi:phage tail protein [Escherichia coli]|nr:phage tail protein [Escherichia coli]